MSLGCLTRSCCDDFKLQLQRCSNKRLGKGHDHLTINLPSLHFPRSSFPVAHSGSLSSSVQYYLLGTPSPGWSSPHTWSHQTQRMRQSAPSSLRPWRALRPRRRSCVVLHWDWNSSGGTSPQIHAGTSFLSDLQLRVTPGRSSNKGLNVWPGLLSGIQSRSPLRLREPGASCQSLERSPPLLYWWYHHPPQKIEISTHIPSLKVCVWGMSPQYSDCYNAFRWP